MSVEIKFKNSNDNLTEYLVSIDGFPPVATGEGAVGRAAAYGMLKFYGLAKEARKRWRAMLDNLFAASSIDASLTFDRTASGILISAIVDGDRLYHGTDIADLEFAISQIAGPSKDRQAPGY